MNYTNSERSVPSNKQKNGHLHHCEEEHPISNIDSTDDEHNAHTHRPHRYHRADNDHEELEQPPTLYHVHVHVDVNTAANPSYKEITRECGNDKVEEYINDDNNNNSENMKCDLWQPSWHHILHSHSTSYQEHDSNTNSIIVSKEIQHESRHRLDESNQPLYKRVMESFFELLRSRRARRNEWEMAETLEMLITHPPSATISCVQSEENNLHDLSLPENNNSYMINTNEKAMSTATPTEVTEWGSSRSSNNAIAVSYNSSNLKNTSNNWKEASSLDYDRIARERRRRRRIFSHFSSAISSYLSHPTLLINVAKQELSFFSLAEALKVCLLVAIVSTGSAMQVIMLNFWLHSYPTYHGNRGNYTTFAISSCIFATFFNFTLLLYFVCYRPSLHFVWERRGVALLIGLGIVDTLNSCLTIYAASHVSEVLQALSTSLIPLITVFFQKSLLHDRRQYLNFTVVFSFACTITGIFVAASYSFRHSTTRDVNTHNNKRTSYNEHQKMTNETESEWSRLCWALLYCAAVLPSVLQNIFQTDYMINFTRDALFEEWFLMSKHAVERVSACLKRRRNKLYLITTSRHSNVNNDKATNYNNNDNVVDINIYNENNSTDNMEIIDGMVFVFNEVDGKTNKLECNNPTVYGTFATLETNAERINTNDNIFSSNYHSNTNNNSHVVTNCMSSKHNMESEIILQNYLHEPEVESFAFTNTASHVEINVGYAVAQGDDLVVKLAMLAIDTSLLALFTLLLLPIDTLPWFGGSRSIHEAWSNLYTQSKQLFVQPLSLMFCLLYCLGFVFTYLGTAYLDQINVTLCALVIQLASPSTALVLLLFPSLNVTGDHTPWQWSLLAIVFMSIGALAYVLWDQKTANEKAIGEFALKEEFVRPHVKVTLPIDKPAPTFDFISKV